MFFDALKILNIRPLILFSDFIFCAAMTSCIKFFITSSLFLMSGTNLLNERKRCFAFFYIHNLRTFSFWIKIICTWEFFGKIHDVLVLKICMMFIFVDVIFVKDFSVLKSLSLYSGTHANVFCKLFPNALVVLCQSVAFF